MQELIQSVDLLLNELTSNAIKEDGLEWYLINNLSDYRSVLNNNPTPLELENATRALTWFCTESIDWDTDLYKVCSEITIRGMSLSKDVNTF